MAKYTIGLDYGTNSVRALMVNVSTGEEIAANVFNYPHGTDGILLDPRDPNLARQHPQDYLDGAETTIKGVLADAAKRGISAADVIGLGIDTTGSTPMPIDASGNALAFDPRFKDNLSAMAWLWKDHTSHAEASEWTALAAKHHPDYLAKCGGKYSSEWFWSKILHCVRVAPDVFDAAATWVEIADWIPASLCGTTAPAKCKRGICGAGHKAFYNTKWGGYAARDFVSKADARLARVRDSLPEKVYNIASPAGALSDAWAKKLGLTTGIPVAVGAFDVHLGAVGSGIEPGAIVKIIGTSTCDLAISPLSDNLADVPGVCGIVPESVLPGYYGVEAGQSAVGDIFNWFVQKLEPRGKELGSHKNLTAEAEKLKPGESGLLCLDWHNGNRTVLVDQRLTGLMLGLTLHTSPAEIYAALNEATGYGARMIIERMEEYKIPVKRIVCGGGIAVKSPMTMQMYADIFARPVQVCQSTQTCALGSAIAAAVVAGTAAGGYANFDDAIAKMATPIARTFTPNPKSVAVYERLFKLYRRLHDSFGIAGHSDALGDVMKELLAIRDEARGVNG